MSLLAVRALALTLGKPLFTQLSFTLAPGARLGLVAANGAGKSTLLRCLIGAEAAQSGEITKARGLTLALAAQEAPPAALAQPLRAFLLAALPPEEADQGGWQADLIMEALGLPPDLADQPLGTLSGGGQRRALIAAAAITAPDLLLLDEPTNHLDLAQIARLEDYLLKECPARGLIIASHDRAFLDRVTTETLFLRPERSAHFALPYSRAAAAFKGTQESEARAYAEAQKEAAQLRRQAAKLHNIGVNSGSDLLQMKTKQLKARAEKVLATAQAPEKLGRAGDIRLAHRQSAARALLHLKNAEILRPGGGLLFRTGEVWITPGDRVALLGGNGAGKTQMLLRIAAALQGQADPALYLTPSLVPGYLDQELAFLPGKVSAEDFLAARFSLAPGTLRSALAGAGLPPPLSGTPIARLSGGQKARLALLFLRLTAPSFYLLDEPTNHLDIEGQEALEGELQKPGASALIVSHDRAFLRHVATRFWQIDPARRQLEEVESPEPFLAAMAAG